MLIYLPATSRPLMFPAERSSFINLDLRDHPFDSLHSEFLSPFNFATHETEDPSQRPKFRHVEGTGNRRKMQKTDDFCRKKTQETADGGPSP